MPTSLPSRGAWIEINLRKAVKDTVRVAPLAGSVDRNFIRRSAGDDAGDVAPLAGSVDRNSELGNALREVNTSLPSRGAWIEITT